MRVFGLPFYRRLVLPFALFFLIVTQVDAIINWTALRDLLAVSSPWKVMMLFTTLFTAWSLIAGAALRPVWGQPTIAFLVRQPLSRWQWVRYLLLPLSIAFVPIICIWWLAPHYANTPMHYVGFTGLAWSIVLGGSFRGVVAGKWIVTGVVTTAALIIGYAYQPIVAIPAAIVSVMLPALSISGIQEQRGRSEQSSSANLASMSRVFAIIRRDLWCLWCRERNSLFHVLELALFAGLLILALRINGEIIGRPAFVYSCGILSLALLPIYDILTRLKSQLGPELMRRRWPISHRQRGAALFLLTLAISAPGLVTLSVIGSTMGTLYLAQFILYAVTTLVALVALFSRSLLTSAASLGWSLWVLLIHAVLVAAIPPWIYVVFAVAIVAIGSQLMVRGLREFTQESEIRIHE